MYDGIGHGFPDGFMLWRIIISLYAIHLERTGKLLDETWKHVGHEVIQVDCGGTDTEQGVQPSAPGASG